MKIEKGMLLRVVTKTINDVFGEVLYEVEETGLQAPEKDREGVMDGLKCVIIGGTGKAARKGYVVIDSEMKVNQDIEAGITKLLPASQKGVLAAAYPEHVGEPIHSGVGCFEM